MSYSLSTRECRTGGTTLTALIRSKRRSGGVSVSRGEGGLVLGLQLLAGRVVAPQRLARVDLDADVGLELFLLVALLGDLPGQMPGGHQHAVPVTDQHVPGGDRHPG